MVEISGAMIGDLKFELNHPSGVKIITSAPLDNGGDGTSFSPTDLCAGSYVSCLSTIFALEAKKKQITIQDIKFTVQKIMNASPRRIKMLVINMDISTSCSREQFDDLVSKAKKCPVALTFHPDVEIVCDINQIS